MEAQVDAIAGNGWRGRWPGWLEQPAASNTAGTSARTAGIWSRPWSASVFDAGRGGQYNRIKRPPGQRAWRFPI